jgi:hypothetical protein
MSAPLFGKNWLEKDEVEHSAAYARFLAAVVAARMSKDEDIEQVSVEPWIFRNFLKLVASIVFV